MLNPYHGVSDSTASRINPEISVSYMSTSCIVTPSCRYGSIKSTADGRLGELIYPDSHKASEQAYRKLRVSTSILSEPKHLMHAYISPSSRFNKNQKHRIIPSPSLLSEPAPNSCGYLLLRRCSSHPYRPSSSSVPVRIQRPSFFSGEMMRISASQQLELLSFCPALPTDMHPPAKLQRGGRS